MVLPCPDCCTDPCPIFTAASFADLTGLTEVEATAAAVGGRLRLTGARALVTVDILHPDAVSGSGGDSRVGVTAFPDTSGGDVQYRVLVAYDDADNYLFLAVFDGDTECSWARLGQRLAGSETWLTAERILPDLSTSRGLYLCWQASTGMLTAHVGSGTAWPDKVYLEAEVTSGLDGDQIGLEFSTGAGLIEFTNLDWKYHKSDVQTTCPECLPPCIFFADSAPAAGCDWTSETSGLISTHFNPQPSEGTRLNVTFDPTASTDAGSILFDWIDDDNYRRVEVDSNGTSGTIKLFRKVATTETQIASEVLDTYDGSGTIDIEVCWFEETVRVAATWSTTLREVFSSAVVGGTRFGLAGTGTFTDFFAQSLAIECDPCPADTGPACGDFDETPEFVLITAAGIVNGTQVACEEYNGTRAAGASNLETCNPQCEPFDIADVDTCCGGQTVSVDPAGGTFTGGPFQWWIILLDDGHYWIGASLYMAGSVPFTITYIELWRDLGTDPFDILDFDVTLTYADDGECNNTSFESWGLFCNEDDLSIRIRTP